LLDRAGRLARAGREREARALHATVDRWWDGQMAWNEQVAELLRVHHDINNALVGIRGHAHLMMLSPEGHHQQVRTRLEVVMRESNRIRDAVALLEVLRAVFTGQGPAAHAA
jgi:nitrogen-specific signal transduction histidine kinase